MSTTVEIVDRNRWVIVLVSEKTREAAETCSSVIRMILDLPQVKITYNLHICNIFRYM